VTTALMKASISDLSYYFSEVTKWTITDANLMRMSS